MTAIDRRHFLTGAAAGTLVSTFAGPVRAAKPAQPKILAGQLGTTHAHAAGKLKTMLSQPENYQVVGVAEPDPRRRAQLEKQGTYQGVKLIGEQELLNTPGLQVVAVETSVADSAAAALRCVEAGKHVHLDKPGGASHAECARIHRAAESQGVVVQMGYMLRYNPAFQFLYQACRDRWLGEIFELHAVMSKTIGPDARRRLPEFSGGAMFELGCHLIDSLVTVLGKPEKITPHLRRTRPHHDSLADNCLAVFDYPRATATVRSSLIEYEGFRRRQFVVCGDRGTIDIRPLESGKVQLALAEGRGKYKRGYQAVEFPSQGRYDGEFEDLAAIVRGEKAPDWNGQHDLTVHRAVLQASAMPLDAE